MGPGRSSSLRIGDDSYVVASYGRIRGASDRLAVVERQKAPEAPLPPLDKGKGRVNLIEYPKGSEYLKSAVQHALTVEPSKVGPSYGATFARRYRPPLGVRVWSPDILTLYVVSVPKMVCFFEVAFDNGLCFPLHHFIKGVLQHFNVCPAQLAPNGWDILVGLLAFFRDRGLCVPSIAFLLYLFSPKETAEGFLYFSRRSRAPLEISDLPSSHRSWKGRYSFVHVAIGNMTLLTRMIPWAFRWLGPPLRIFVSVCSVFDITCIRLLNISDSASSSCFPGTRIDFSAEDNVVALALAECPARPYAELTNSDIPGPSNLSYTRSTALRPSPPSTMGVSPIGPSAANPTRGELLAQLETLSRKPQSAKRKTSGSTKKDRLVLAKVQKLGASSSSLPTHARKPERAPSPPSEAPTILSLQPHSGSTAQVKNLLGEAVEQPLAIMPISIWNPPTRSVRSPSRRAEKSKRKDMKSESGDSLLLNAELATGAVSSILKDFDLERSKAISRGRRRCPLMRL